MGDGGSAVSVEEGTAKAGSLDGADWRWVSRVRLGLGVSAGYVVPLLALAGGLGDAEMVVVATVAVTVGGGAWLIGGREPGRADDVIARWVRWAGMLMVLAMAGLWIAEAKAGEIVAHVMPVFAAACGLAVAALEPVVTWRGTWPVVVAQLAGVGAWGILVARLMGMPGGRRAGVDVVALQLGVVPGVIWGWAWWVMGRARPAEPVVELEENAGRAAAEEGLTLCPECGYDLRGATEDRCSECGLVVDRRRLHVSGYPWAHRQRIGRVRAYARTVWGVTRDDRRLRHEAARVQDPADGRRFRLVNAAVFAVSLLAVWGWIVRQYRGLEFLAYEPRQAWGAPGMPKWFDDVAVPWSAGATMLWVAPACLILLAWYWTGVQQAVFRLGRMPAGNRARAGAIAHYAAAPLGLGPVALAFLGMAPAAGGGVGAAVALALGVVGGLIGFVAVAGTLLRVGQWVSRVRYAGVALGVFAAAELLALWVWGVVLTLGLVPWLVGYVWVVVDGFR